MSSTPIWVAFAIAVISVVGTLAGGIVGSVLTQRWSSAREERSWTREHERQREQWLRDDQARIFEYRREAYLDFYAGVKDMARAAYDKCMGLIFDGSPEPEDHWHQPTFEKLQRLQFYADRELARAASDSYNAAWSWGMNGKFDEPDDPDFHGFQERYDDTELTMLALMRNRLGIAEGDLGLPPPGHSYETGDGAAPGERE
jgi:hypothetical protein